MGFPPAPQPLPGRSTIAIAEGAAGRRRGGRRVLDPLILRRHKLRNAAHAVLLVGGMVAVLAALAWVLFGTAGVVWAVVLGGVALAVRPTVPPRWVLSMYGARPLHPRAAPELHRLVAVLADRAALPTVPVLHYIPTTMPNAFAVGRPDDAAIAVTDGLLRRLTSRELVGVLAHEISHIRSDDLWIMSMSDTIGRVTQILAYIGVLLVLLTLPLTAGGTSAPLWFAVILTALPTVVMLLQLALSRSREYDSDLEAAMLTGDPDGLARALEQLERADGRIWEQLRVPNRRTPDPFLLRTHPPMSERTRRLRELAGRDDRQRLGDARHIPPAGYPQVKPPQASSCPSGYDALVRDARELADQRESGPGGRQAGPTATPAAPSLHLPAVVALAGRPRDGMSGDR